MLKARHMSDIWRDVPGSGGAYRISISEKEGRCFSNITNKLMTINPSKDGRIRWDLSFDGKHVSQQAAYWVAITYPELVQNEWFPGAEIDHIDTDPMNNHPSNLRWVTHSGNQNNDKTIKNMKKSHLGNLNMGHVRWVIKLSKNNEILHFYPSAAQASRDTGIKRTAITNCCNGRSKTAGGFCWKHSE